MVEATRTIVDVPGISIGHTTLQTERTGCTVLLFDTPALTAAEVRGAAPGTRELDLLAPGRSVQRADAIVLSGGSAFGLRAAQGVMEALSNVGRGFPTPAIPVPIVPAAVIFDLPVGLAESPSPDDGAMALRTASPFSQVETGAVGVGAGATWGKMLGEAGTRDSGFGMAQVPVLGGTVTACAVVNALGVVMPGEDMRPLLLQGLADAPFGQNTTLVAVVTDVRCGHDALTRMCVAAHDGLARTIWPAHTIADGDVAFASTVNEGPTDPMTVMPLSIAAELAVEEAIRAAAGV